MTLTVSRLRRLGIAIALLAVVQPLGLPGTLADGPRGDLATPTCDSAATAPPLSGDLWIASQVTTENSGQSSQWRMSGGRPPLVFGDGTWDTVAADESRAVATSRGRRSRGETLRLSAPLWASLQAWKVRLQI